MRIITPHKFYADRQSEWLSKDPPEWYKNQKPDYNKHPGQTMVKFCPSFVELFSNSLVLKSPVDMEFVYEQNGTVSWRCADDLSGFIGSFDHDFQNQIDEYYHQKYVSFKMFLDMAMISDKVESVIFLPPEYHPQTEQASIIYPMIGILETIPNKSVQGLCNFRLDRSLLEKHSHIFIPKGTTLAYYYFPNGAPKEIEYVPREEFDSVKWIYTEYRAEYLRTLRKSKKAECPFHKENS